MPNKKPTIVYDQDIPYLAGWLSTVCELQPYQAGALSAEQLHAADGLIVRSVTTINAELLANTPCRWVGSVTAGINHLDTDFLAQAGVNWASAQGANAPAVCEYVLSALFLAQQAGVVNTHSRLAVIGVGEVGSRVVAACEALGFSVLCYDPPRAKRDPHFVSANWQDLADCDLAIVCASYSQVGEFPSHQLIRAPALQNWRGIINVARGEIVDYNALFTQPSPLWTVLDVWPDEPNIDSRWVKQATIATPHIAGYSRESKWRLSEKIYQACCDFFHLPKQSLVFEGQSLAVAWSDSVGLVALSAQMQAALNDVDNAATFHQLRRDYPLR